MENPNPPVRLCVLKVGIKCCKGCQTNAKRKLLNVTGVNAVEHNEEQGLLTVSGKVNPTMLLHKLTKWGKKAEIVTVVVGDSLTSEQNQIKTMEKNKPTNSCCLLMCFGNRSREAKPLATPNMNYRGLVAENVNSAMPFINAGAPPMLYPPPPQAVPVFATPVPYPPPIFGASQSPKPYNGGMFSPAQPQSPPYFQTQFPQMVNSRMNYPHH